MFGALGNRSQVRKKPSPNRGVHEDTTWFWRDAWRSVMLAYIDHSTGTTPGTRTSLESLGDAKMEVLGNVNLDN
jgi:hypothetical protein